MDDDMDIEAMLDAPLEKKKQEDTVSESDKVSHCQAFKRNARAAEPNLSLTITCCQRTPNRFYHIWNNSSLADPVQFELASLIHIYITCEE